MSSDAFSVSVAVLAVAFAVLAIAHLVATALFWDWQ